MIKPLPLLFLLAPVMASAQAVNPAPQGLPYFQDFSALPHSATVLPPGWQGWALSGAPSASFNTAPAAGNKALAAGSSASSTTNGVHNYNGKVGFLNSGAADNALVLSVNTTGNTGVRVGFLVMTLRNPYDGAANTRINEAVLQYRADTTAAFTSLPATAYQNNTTQQTASGVTSPQNPVYHEVLLPADCENRPVVQLRWVNRQMGGGGSRPSFAVDSVTVAGVSGDSVPPQVSALMPIAGAANVQPGTALVITFNENIKKNAGAVTVYDRTAGAAQTISMQSPSIIIDGSSLRIGAATRGNRSYYVTVDSNAVQDSNGNSFAGITDTAAWHFSTGPQVLDFDFTDCTGGLPNGFSQYSVTGAQVWDCTSFGQTGQGVQINGFASGARENEDWLISPVLDFSSFNYPLLAFASRSAFAGPALELRISTDYSGSGDPRLATWTALNGRFPEVGSDTWKTSAAINLAAFKGTSVYLAWVYTSSPELQASRWTLDDVHFSNAATPPPPSVTTTPQQLDFDYVKAGQRSAPQPFTCWANDLTGPLQVTAPAGFEISSDQAQYFPSLTYTPSGPVTIWARFAPGAANQYYSGAISFSSPGLAAQQVALAGTSLRTLKVVNWNMEWFGHLQFGPTDEALQQANALKVLRYADADIYALSEVVDTDRLKALVDSMPGYRYTVSDFGSYADSLTAPGYDSTQKLAFVYRHSLVKNLRTYGVMRQGASAEAYRNWSSGRFPYLMESTVILNGDTARVHFIAIHAKANTGNAADKIESWYRRKNGAKELKDTLDAYFPYKNVLVLGDFNDDFDRTITTEMPDTTTSYIDFKLDSANYTPFTYALSLARQRSTASFADMIDHAMGTNEMLYAYVPQSARVLRSVETLIPSYASRTSDHFPVATRYDVRVLARPVVISRFTARPSGGGVALSWETEREINNQHFIVERSAHQRSFSPIDTVPAAAPNGQGAAYLRQDDGVLPGYWHYRLKQVGKDGTVQYSEVQSVLVISREAWFRLLCFILGRQLHIYLDAPQSGPASIQLIDMQGNIRYQAQVGFTKGRNVKTVDVGQMPPGIYLLRVQSGNRAEVKKVFIYR
ncbi:Ig-like domain-containing protein [Chitinophaga alhagiae]|uniref:Ig-like domain-containing protein n=1 Tax=Chitinophaga alhagiae TaxID=2203219 RepID=UPI000E5C0D4C|nr:Ig-like domain-containing protein [Chitinophaga alhagiae]